MAILRLQLVFAFIFCATLVNLASTQTIVLYEHRGHQGLIIINYYHLLILRLHIFIITILMFVGGRLPITLAGTRCINLPDWANDWASSVDTRGSCAELCEHANCNGRCDQFLPRSSHHHSFDTLGFNDRVTSVRGCRYKK